MNILRYEDGFAISLQNKFTKLTDIEGKHQFKYLIEYLGVRGLDVKTILVEEKYISKDFLDDYSNYYSYCFEGYGNHCRRIHLWSDTFNQTLFRKVLENDEDTLFRFKAHYMGFIVIKPIPYRIIGYTLLRQPRNYFPILEYEDQLVKTDLWGLREYKIHLLGVELTIDTLAFQEQDTVVAACATTSIWSALNKASKDDHTILRSPSEITKIAGDLATNGNRIFPNYSGLDVLQICQAIHKSGLASEVKTGPRPIDVQDPTDQSKTITAVTHSVIKQVLNAYSTIGIPLILIVSVPFDGENGTTYGYHALTVVGFQKNNAPLIKTPENNTLFLSDRISTIIVHDDQIGPYVRISFDEEPAIKTFWQTPEFTKSYVSTIVLPVYPKIRIAYEDIQSIVYWLDRILTGFVVHLNKLSDEISWDIHVRASSDYMNDIRVCNLGYFEKKYFINTSQPKYIWIASAYVEEDLILDFIFDATDVPGGSIGMQIVSFIEKDELVEFCNFLNNNKMYYYGKIKKYHNKLIYDRLCHIVYLKTM